MIFVKESTLDNKGWEENG